MVAKLKLRYVSRKYIIAKGFGSCNQKVRQRDKILCPPEDLHFDWQNKEDLYVFGRTETFVMWY